MNLDKPFYQLPEEIKQWVRDRGYVIRETNTSATVKNGWISEYNDWLNSQTPLTLV